MALSASTSPRSCPSVRPAATSRPVRSLQPRGHRRAGSHSACASPRDEQGGSGAATWQQPQGSPALSLATAAAAALLAAAPASAASELAAAAALQQMLPPQGLSFESQLSPSSASGDLLVAAAASAPALAGPAAAPSLVASPLSGDATADLTAAVTQQVVAVALSPNGSAELAQSVRALAAGGEQQQQQQQQAAAAAEERAAPALAAEASQPAEQQQQQQQEGEAALPQRLWAAYLASLGAAPLRTKMATGAAATLLGDLVAQAAAHHAAPARARRPAAGGAPEAAAAGAGFAYDAPRAARLAAYNAAVATPMNHFWFALLDAGVLPADPAGGAAVCAKVLLDQALQTPAALALFFATIKLLEGRPGEAGAEVQAKLLPTLIANWCLWPAAQLVNFAFVPLELRILYVNAVSVAWTAYISTVASGAAAGEQQQQQQARQRQEEAAAAPARPGPRLGRPRPRAAVVAGAARGRAEA
ncbi:MAG: hypothetical protein J3K34DRAFT_523829 [Monoraphidium minutum]|nr:MAG: hypothetical protein J3K34DRAFT_523829 [Monoraphidium minutum]